MSLFGLRNGQYGHQFVVYCEQSADIFREMNSSSDGAKMPFRWLDGAPISLHANEAAQTTPRHSVELRAHPPVSDDTIQQTIIRQLILAGSLLISDDAFTRTHLI